MGADSTEKTALLFIAEAKQNMDFFENEIDPNKIKKWLRTKFPKTPIFVEVTYR